MRHSAETPLRHRPKQPPEILPYSFGEQLQRLAQQFRRKAVNGAQVCRVIDRLATGRVRERILDALGRQELIRRVRLNEQTVGQHGPEALALPGLALLREVTRQREIGAQLRQRRDHLERPAEGVQQEAAARTRPRVENLQQPAPSLQTMDAHRQVPLRRQPQVPGKQFLMLLRVAIPNPPIQTALADGRRHRVQMSHERRLPVRRPLLYVPGVIAECRDDLRPTASQRQHFRPIFFTRPVDNHPGDAFLLERREDGLTVRRQAGVLQMIMGVVEPKAHCLALNNRANWHCIAGGFARTYQADILMLYPSNKDTGKYTRRTFLKTSTVAVAGLSVADYGFAAPKTETLAVSGGAKSVNCSKEQLAALTKWPRYGDAEKKALSDLLDNNKFY